MTRFTTLEEAQVAARAAAEADYRRHKELGFDLNPFCTPGARTDWQRGYDNAGPRTYESPEIVKWNTIYLRGRAAAEIVKENEGALK